MPYLSTAIFLIILSSGAALGVAWEIDPSKYFDINVICERIGEAPSACAAGAREAGIVSCVGGLLAGILLLGINRRLPAQNPPPEFGRRTFLLMGIAVAVYIVISLYIEATTPLPLNREEPFWRRPAMISIGNLIWPLCLQLANRAGNFKWRLAFLGLLVPILAYSPFRGLLFAIAVFGVVVPAIERGLRGGKGGGTLTFGRLLGYGGVVVLVAGIIGQQLVVQTIQRTSNLNLAGKSEAEQVTEKMIQRTSIPLFQAHLAAERSLNPNLPSILDEIAVKLRFRPGLNINSYLFADTHGGVSLGETTSLFYGEGALRTGGFPIVWTVVAPLVLLLGWGVLRLVRLDASTLFALALWRGSLGGLISVVPALAIQVAVLYVLTRIENAGKHC